MTLHSEFEALLHSYQQPITTYLCNLLGDEERGQELAQETFLRAYRALARGLRVDHSKAWLYRIATNAARDHLRRRRLLTWLPLFGNEPALEVEGPEEDLVASERMRRALLQLSPDYRIPLVLYTCHEFTVAEIASALELSTDAVKQRLVRARKQLREAYR